MRRCLVVDDSRVIRKVARRILEDMRFEIEEAADGLEALQACRRQMPEAQSSDRLLSLAAPESSTPGMRPPRAATERP
jgi:CheY-like chemotaxis protein